MCVYVRVQALSWYNVSMLKHICIHIHISYMYVCMYICLYAMCYVVFAVHGSV